MRKALGAGLVCVALAGCVGPRGGHYVGGDAAVLFHGSQSQAHSDEFCRVEMHAHIIYSTSEIGSNGLTPEEQLRRYYRICMANHGYPDADLEATAPAGPALQ